LFAGYPVEESKIWFGGWDEAYISDTIQAG